MRSLRFLAILAILALLCAPLAQAADGEGTARIVSPRYLVAGENARVIIEYTVGETPIPAGGGVCMGLHHAAYWPAFQTTAPNEPGYVTVESESPAEFAVSFHEWNPKGMFTDGATGQSDRIHHRVTIAKVTEGTLAPGTTVTFTLGAGPEKARVFEATDKDHEFHITTDADGDGVYHGIRVQPQLDIVAAEPHHFAAFGPAMIPAGEPVELLIRAEDEYINCASSYEGSVDVRGENGAALASNVQLHDGVGHVVVTVDEPGPVRFRISDGTLEGRSNPARVFQELPKYKIYWADVHGHTDNSDGLGNDAYAYYDFARNQAGLDVCALTDHGHFQWVETQEAARAFNEPGRFVTILAQEGGAGADHVNFYFRSGDEDHIQGWPNRYDVLQQTIYDQYNSGERPEALIGPHHFSYDRGDDRYPFGIWDDRVSRFIEVYSSHGTSEYLNNPRPCPGAKDPRKFMQYGLDQGLRFGVIAASDNHDSHPGRSLWGKYPGGLAAFLAEDLTREDIWQTWWNRRVYATSLDRIYLEFTINGAQMGQDVHADGPVEVSYYVIGKQDDVEAVLLRNNEEIRRDSSEEGHIEVSFNDDAPEGEKHYYVRVVQENGERAWSTPIWVTR